MLSNFNKKVTKTVIKEEEQFIVFKIANEEFGVDVKQAKEIIPHRELTHIPNAPSFVRGVINLRGDIIPIINLSKKLSLNESLDNQEEKIIIVELDNSLIGMQVDDVSEMIRLDQDNIADPPDIVKGINKYYLSGVGKLNDRLLILLDLNNILTEEEIKELDKIDID